MLDVILAQVFSVLIVNMVAYLQLALIGRWKFLTHMGPILRVTGFNLVAVLCWVVFMRWIYARDLSAQGGAADLRQPGI